MSRILTQHLIDALTAEEQSHPSAATQQALGTVANDFDLCHRLILYVLEKGNEAKYT